ncbi:MAG: tRNA dihydrouridine synthase DusB [Planctomycetes bacterium]|nr:tRNA dihydrouridine synthase DusB [Planctomycetota bacterium]
MLRIGSVQLETNLLLAPLAGYTDMPFRLVVREAGGGLPGVGLAFTELLCSNAILNESHKTLWLASTCPRDQPLGMQLYGRDPETLAEAARWAEAHGATTIDINMGCPVDKVTKHNGGSMLLCNPVSTVELAAHVVKSVRVPVTAKIRLGWDDSRIVGPTIAPALADVGIACITVHGRTTEQMFKPSVRLEGIALVVEAMKKHHPNIPVIGNGDIKSPQDAKRMIDVTGCDGVMIGRGALGQPWIFRDTHHLLTTGDLPAPVPRRERVRLVVSHFDHLMRCRGERIAVNMINQRISWYSPYLQPWPGLKQGVRTLRSAAEFHDFMARGVEDAARRFDEQNTASALGEPAVTA